MTILSIGALYIGAALLGWFAQPWTLLAALIASIVAALLIHSFGLRGIWLQIRHPRTEWRPRSPSGWAPSWRDAWPNTAWQPTHCP